VTSTAATQLRRKSPAERLLETATELFADYGIRPVGIDRILRESGVAKASLYSSYGSKEGLVRAYLHGLDMRDRTRWENAVADVADPIDRLLTFFDLAVESAQKRNYRGCQYLNATTEFPGTNLPMLEPVREHRDWVLGEMTELLTVAGDPEPSTVAARIQLVYDGALAGSKFAHSEESIRLGRRMAVDLIHRLG
jgi:AcrR family transcriptional regulator